MERTCFSALLLTLSLVTSQADKCIIGVVGENVHLPCIYNGVKNLTALLISSEWRRDMKVHITEWIDSQNVSRTTVSSAASNTGDFTLEMRDIHLSDAQNYSLHLKVHGQENSVLICTVCLSVAAHFSHPTLLRKNIMNGEETRLVCNTTGGFPVPNIYWRINHTQRPSDTRVTTYVNTLPQSGLYNITSVLSINISPETAVSCVIENKMLNETLTATNYGVKSSLEDGRHSKFLWMFTTVMCVVVFLLVALSLCIQRKLDKDRKKHYRRRDDSCSEETEMITMNMEQWASLPETDV
ncbi:ICOS ligand [Misgurnus anguillicaudatus]|uniref:ICOS ligand n=1 Tax=Misgurnus anguillicaudatus TaxID=75329 RepID=UPI003CCF8743